MNERRRAVLVTSGADVDGSLRNAERAGKDHELVAVLGTAAGWYSALATTGVLASTDAERLMGQINELIRDMHPAGGQLIYPLTDAAWRPDDALRVRVEAAISEAGGAVWRSVDLGGYLVLGGTPDGLERLATDLRPTRVGDRDYPMRLPSATPLHTPLMATVADAARERLADVRWQVPERTLIDGCGARHTPWSADPQALADYTLAEQLTDTYRFATALRVALREYAPDVVILSGAGAGLLAVCGQIVVGEGYRGIRSRGGFLEAQRRNPVILWMRR